ncbi:MAG: hypothetical protein EpisKO_41900 [Epibacterium sp.]
MSGCDICRVRVLGEIERHQGLKRHALGECGKNAVAIGAGLGAGDNRGHEIGHDDGAAKMAGCLRQHRAQHVAVAQMQMPVVGAGDRQALGHGAGVSTAP